LEYQCVEDGASINVPPNSLRDPNVGPRVKQRKKKKIGACSLIRSTSRVKGMMEFWTGTRMNSQAQVQDEINLHNKKKRAISAS